MNATHKLMIEEEIKTLQGELHSLVKQKQGFLMGSYDDWSSAIQLAKDRGWILKPNSTEYHLYKTGEKSIIIEFKDGYTEAICKRDGKTTIQSTPKKLLAYINKYTADLDDDDV